MTRKDIDANSILGQAFPFHFILDAGMKILEAGPRLRDVAKDMLVGRQFSDVFELHRPELAPTFEKIKVRIDSLFIIGLPAVPDLRLRGQFFPVESFDGEALIFLGHPWITDLSEMEQIGLALHDFPQHAGIADMLVLLQAKNQGLVESRRLANRLKEASNELQSRNDQLLEELERRKLLEETVLHAQKMEAIGQLAGGVAHDFNNILLAISGHCALAMKGLQEDEPALKNLQSILDATKRASEMTARLLAFGRRQIMVPENVDVVHALEEIEQILKPLLGEMVALSIECSKDVGKIWIDPSGFQQVLLNLAINARDSFSRKGRISITASRFDTSEQTRLATGVLEAGEWVRIEVRDNGSGMDDDVIDRMFEPFFTTKEQGEGTGLGLSTVWWILERFKGTIDVRSTSGEGTLFSIYIPSTTGSDDEEDLELVSTSTDVSAGNLLLVEDDEMVRKPIAEILRGNGWQVTEAGNGAEAMEIVESDSASFDVILTDLVMPGVDGRELAQMIRSTWPQIPVVLMTGYDAGAAGQVADESNLIITKPFTHEELEEVLQKARASSEG